MSLPSLWAVQNVELTESYSLGRRIIIGLYAALHSQGVVHNDIAMRHLRQRPIRISSGADLRLIDFECSKSAGSEECGREMEHLKARMRGFNGKWKPSAV